ncbi:MAG: adenosylhomocysteinase [Synergistales bacterium]
MPKCRIARPDLAPDGHRKIAWAWAAMPVLRLIHEKYGTSLPFRGITISACLHLEAKTACLLKVLKDLGANVAAAGSNPLSTQDDVCAALVEEGISVFSRRGMSSSEYIENLRAVMEFGPRILIDDGADLVALVHEEMPEIASGILGGSEETTTGIKRLKAMEKEGVLRFPMLAVNDAYSKFLFDNRYGTGQSVMDGLLRTTNNLLAGKLFVVAGYGWCGRGIATRAAGLGARVTVVEADPHRALEALMDGRDVRSMDEAAPLGDIFVTATGNLRVIRKEHLEKMKNGAILANAGHFNVEIDIPAIESLSVRREVSRANIETFELADGRKLHLLAEGRLVNLAAADGHPIEIMDLSFALQLLSSLYILEHPDLPARVLRVPEDLDRSVSELKIESLGIRLETLTDEQRAYLASWKE